MVSLLVIVISRTAGENIAPTNRSLDLDQAGHLQMVQSSGHASLIKVNCSSLGPAYGCAALCQVSP